MNPIRGIWVFGFAIASYICLAVFYLFECQTYKNSHDSKYDWRNHFPFEIIAGYGKAKWQNLIFLILSLGFDVALAGYLSIQIEFHQGLLVTGILYLVCVFLRDIAIFAVFYVPVDYLKAHFIAFIGECGLAILSCVIAFLAFFSTRYDSFPIFLTFSILTSVVGLFALGVLLNPRLAAWAKLDSKAEEDGTVVYIRPKRFVLAYSEWIILFASYLASLISAIGFFVADIA